MLRRIIQMMSSGVAAIEYDLKALFTGADQTFVDGQVLNSAAEGVETGSLTVVALEGEFSIASNKMAFTAQNSPAWGEQGLVGEAVTRSIGLAGFNTVNQDAKASFPVLFNAVADTQFTTGEANFHLSDIGAGTIYSYYLAQGVVLGSFSASTDYQTCVVIGGYDLSGVPYKLGDIKVDFTYGFSQFIKGGLFTTWTLLWSDTRGNTSTLYPAFSNYAAAGTLDNLLIPDYDFSTVLQPTVLDTFTDVDGTSLDAHTMDVGGGWTEQVGTAWDIQNNKASITPAAGSDGDMATVESGISDCLLSVVTAPQVINASNNSRPCLVFRYSDSSNFWYTRLDKPLKTFKLFENNAGSHTERASIVYDPGANIDRTIKVILDGATIMCFVEDGFKITYASSTFNQTASKHGIMYLETGTPPNPTTFDNFSIHPRTSSTYESTFAAGTDSIY